MSKQLQKEKCDDIFHLDFIAIRNGLNRPRLSTNGPTQEKSNANVMLVKISRLLNMKPSTFKRIVRGN